MLDYVGQIPSRSLVGGLVLAFVLFAVSIPGSVAQDAMCGQDIVKPTNLTLYEYVDAIEFRVTPVRAVVDPSFEITFPTGLFFGELVQDGHHALNMTVRGCISGSDFNPNVTILATTGLITGKFKGNLQPGTPCSIWVSPSTDIDDPRDLRAPERILGNITDSGNYYFGWQVNIKDANGVLLNVGQDTDQHTAAIENLNQLLGVDLNGVLGSNKAFTGYSDNLDAIVLTFTPAFADPTDSLPDDSMQHMVMGPNDTMTTTRQINITFTHQLTFGTDLDAGFGTFLMDVSGCLTASGVKVWTNQTLVFADLGEQTISQSLCTVTLNKGSGTLKFPRVDNLAAEVVLSAKNSMSNFSQPLFGGRSTDIVTTGFKSLTISNPSGNFTAGSDVPQITFVADPKNVGISSTSVRLDLSGFSFSNWDVIYGGETDRDFAMDITGCGASIASGKVTSTCSSSVCSLTLNSDSLWSLQAGACTITVKKQVGSKLSIKVPVNSTQLVLTLGLIDYNADRGLSVIDSVDYGQIIQNIYGLTATKVVPSSTGSGDPLGSVVLSGVTSTAIPASSTPQIWLTVPKVLGIQNTKAYKVQVTGCTSQAITQEFTVPDEPLCDNVFKVDATGGISAGQTCVVTLLSSSSNPGLFRNPPSDFTVQFELATVANGNVVDSADPSTVVYRPVGASSGDLTPLVAPSSSALGAKTGSLLGFIVCAVVMVFM